MKKESKFKQLKDEKNNKTYIIDIQDIIGRGAFGTVFKGYFYQDGTINLRYPLAIKQSQIFQQQGDRYEMMMRSINEIEQLRQMNHPNIVKYIDSKTTKDNLYLIMEYANGGNLIDFINHKNGLNEVEALFYFGQIIDAFRYLRIEKNRIVHRDIKPENILIQYTQDKTILKLADFGSAKPQINSQGTKAFTGTALFLSPEQMKDEKGDIDMDIWQLGLLLYFMIFYDPKQHYDQTNQRVDYQQCLPWCGKSHEMEKLIKSNPIDKILDQQNLSNRVRELLIKFLKYEKKQRITWDEIFYHSLLASQISQNDFAMSLKSINQSVGLMGVSLDNIINDNLQQSEGLRQQQSFRLEDLDFDREEQILIDFKKKQDEDRKRINKSNVKEAIKYEMHVSQFIYKTAMLFYSYKKEKPINNQFLTQQVSFTQQQGDLNQQQGCNQSTFIQQNSNKQLNQSEIILKNSQKNLGNEQENQATLLNIKQMSQEERVQQQQNLNTFKGIYYFNLEFLDENLQTQAEYILHQWSFMFINRLKQMMVEKNQIINYPIEGWDEFLLDQQTFEQYHQKVDQQFQKQKEIYEWFIRKSEPNLKNNLELQQYFTKELIINKKKIENIILNTLQQLFTSPILQKISNYIKKNQELNSKQFQFLYLMDNLLMIYCFDSTFSLPSNKKKDLQQFIKQRNLADPSIIFSRIITAFLKFGWMEDQ